MAGKKIIFVLVLLMIVVSIILAAGYSKRGPTSSNEKTVPHEERWGIYALDLAKEKVELIHSSPTEISILGLNNSGNRLAFSQKIGGDDNEHTEICTVGVDGSNFERLTNNNFWDVYPCWSPDGSKIAFLSMRETMDIYVMDATGGNVEKLYDSGSHDADINWVGDKIVFTANSRIWSMNDDGTEPTPITDPPNAGQWGNANLPFGDYDPRLSSDGTKIIFERLVDDNTPHGNYNIYIIGSDGSGETALTNNGYTQGLASWSHSGDKIVYTVAAINGEGKYDLYMMNSDGTNNHNITPDYFPATFLCNSPVFSSDDSKILFLGWWWS